MRKQKGSFTIEAIIWIPLILCMMLCTIKEGLSFYEESIYCESTKELEAWDGVSRFYEMWILKELGDEADDE